MIKMDKNLNISADSQPIYTKLPEESLFFQGGQNDSQKSYAIIKTFPVGPQCSWEILLFVG